MTTTQLAADLCWHRDTARHYLNILRETGRLHVYGKQGREFVWWVVPQPGNPGILTTGKLRDAWSRVQAGESMEAVARSLGVHRKTLRDNWRKRGYPVLGARRDASTDCARAALILADARATVAFLAADLGLPSRRVTEVLRQMQQRGHVETVGRSPGGSGVGRRALVWTLTDAGRAWLAEDP